MDSKPQQPEPWRRHAERERLVSAMNNTKWRETVEAMRQLIGGPPGFRVKDTQGPEPGDTDWDCDWFHHTGPWETIEWLEIRPDPRQNEIVLTLKKIGVPISLEHDRIRIWGWLRPDASPRYM